MDFPYILGNKVILSLSHEEEIVRSAVNNGGNISASIKEFYSKYFPIEFSIHTSNRDWSKCLLNRKKVNRWYKNFLEIGYHRKESKDFCQIPPPKRPTSLKIRDISLSDYEKSILVYKYQSTKERVKTLKI